MQFRKPTNMEEFLQEQKDNEEAWNQIRKSQERIEKGEF